MGLTLKDAVEVHNSEEILKENENKQQKVVQDNQKLFDREELRRQIELFRAEEAKRNLKIDTDSGSEPSFDDEKKSMQDKKRESRGLQKEKAWKAASKRKQKKLVRAGKTGEWFQTICFMRIPIIGFIYIVVLALSKKTPLEKKSFAKAYIIYKVLVWVLAAALLYCLYKVGLNFLDGILQYASGN